MQSEVFTASEKKAAKALTCLWETGSFVGKAHLLVTLKDSAGITFGKSQTTENSGGLSELVFGFYVPMGGALAEAFGPYKEQLYSRGGDKSKKSVMTSTGESRDDFYYEGGLTNNQEFKDLLVKAAREDPIMSKAQDLYFEKFYFKPALWICAEFGLTEALSLAFVYDFCIHSGPGSRFNDGAAFDRLSNWNDDYESPDVDDEKLVERAWTTHMCKKRDAFLRSLRNGYTAYRTTSMLKIMSSVGDREWGLQTPLSFVFFRKEFTNYPDRNMTLTAQDLDKIYAS